MTSATKSPGSGGGEPIIQEICALITERTGVQLGPKQVSMVESRMKRRLMELGLADFDEYRAFLNKHRAEEVEALVSLLTTHHTFFFREFVQFEFLEQQLPSLVRAAKARGAKCLEVLSLACSRGQEVYSLAMHLDRHLRILAPGFDFRILGADVDSKSVKVAANGVYRRDELKTVPIAYLGNHWAKGTGEIADFVKARASIREKCDFATVNLLDLKELKGRKFDFIFCRNVFIYFTPQQVKDISAAVSGHLHPNGLFFVGISEALHRNGSPLRSVGPSVYALASAAPARAEASSADDTATLEVTPAAIPMPLPNPLRVLCVDDSSSILTLLKKVLSKDHGFEVVGTAANGQEAIEQMRKLSPHLITLDIHMPVKTGVEFLEETKGQRRPPVLMVTSVSRDDAGLAWKALDAGAADYVEKPALNNLEERADEIRMKLKSAFRARGAELSRDLDRQFAADLKIPDPQACRVLCVLGLGDIERGKRATKELLARKVPVTFAVEGANGVLPALAEKAKREGIADVLPLKEAVVAQLKGKGPLSVLVFGEVSKHGAQEILSLSGAQLILEDMDGGKGAQYLQEVASDILPATSFGYVAAQFLAGGKAKNG